MEFRTPPSLKPGDKVAILSPSAGLPHLFPWVYEQGLQRIKELFQLVPVEFPTALQSPEFLAKNPKARADDLHRAFADPSIKAIISTIGGNDQIRILPYLDSKLLSAHPKIFLGYSDNTCLHLFLWNLGIISYYGGSVMTQFAMGGGMHDYTIESLRNALFQLPVGEVTPPPFYSDADLDWADKSNLTKKRPHYPNPGWIWHQMPDKVIEGRLFGGCLEVLYMHLAVKRYLPDFDRLNGTILFLETSEGMPCDGFVYRFISALAELGLLQRFKAILMGIPKAQFCGKEPPEGREAYILNQQKAVKNALRDYQSDMPVLFNFNIGHTDPQLILPNGGLISINPIDKTIKL